MIVGTNSEKYHSVFNRTQQNDSFALYNSEFLADGEIIEDPKKIRERKIQIKLSYK